MYGQVRPVACRNPVVGGHRVILRTTSQKVNRNDLFSSYRRRAASWLTNSHRRADLLRGLLSTFIAALMGLKPRPMRGGLPRTPAIGGPISATATATVISTPVPQPTSRSQAAPETAISRTGCCSAASELNALTSVVATCYHNRSIRSPDGAPGQARCDSFPSRKLSIMAKGSSVKP